MAAKIDLQGFIIHKRVLCQQVGSLGLPPSAPLVTTSGQPCFLPLNFNGTQLNGCVNIHSSRQPVCWVQNVGWQVRPPSQ